MKSQKSLTLLFILVFLRLASASDKEPAWQPWRSPKNQGINVLFCYLHVNRVACEYSDLVKDQAKEVGPGAYSANTLVHLAERYGVALRVASLTMKEFDSCGKPVITYMTSDTLDDGGFILVINSTDSEVFYVDAATAAMQSMSRENFRRVWSGIALLPAIGRMENWMFFGLALSAGLIVTLLIRSRLACKISQSNQ